VWYILLRLWTTAPTLVIRFHRFNRRSQRPFCGASGQLHRRWSSIRRFNRCCLFQLPALLHQLNWRVILWSRRFNRCSVYRDVFTVLSPYAFAVFLVLFLGLWLVPNCSIASLACSRGRGFVVRTWDICRTSISAKVLYRLPFTFSGRLFGPSAVPRALLIWPAIL